MHFPMLTLDNLKLSTRFQKEKADIHRPINKLKRAFRYA